MDLVSVENVDNSFYDEQVFRTSSVGDLVAFCVFFTLLLACLGLFIRDFVLGTAGFWLRAIYIWCGFWFGVIARLAWKRFRASLLASNWLMKVSSNRLLIKFRSFQNDQYPETDPAVICLGWREIEWVRTAKETSIKPDTDGSLTEFWTYLDLKLNLSADDLQIIGDGLARERKNKPLVFESRKRRRELAEGGKGIASENDRVRQLPRYERFGNDRNKIKPEGKYDDYPVTLMDGNILRVRWTRITPDIKAAMALCAERTRLVPEIEFITDSTSDS